jgi:BASS family bile acid:Na+ symporter
MELFRQYESVLAAAQLVLAMLGMGATLRGSDFASILTNRKSIVLVLLLQFAFAPLVAAAMANYLPLPPGIAFGIVLLAVMPSGALSNLFTHLGGGNMALSITATIASTLLCLIATPWLLKMLAGWAIEGGINMPVSAVVIDVSLYLLIPMLIGMYVRMRYENHATRFSNWMVRLSMIVLLVIVFGSLKSGRIEVWEHGWTVPVLLIGCAIGQYAMTQVVSQIIGLSPGDCYTLAIEVSIRNGNLAILLSGTLFANATAAEAPISAGSLYVALFYGGAALVLAIIGIWTKMLTSKLKNRPLPE